MPTGIASTSATAAVPCATSHRSIGRRGYIMAMVLAGLASPAFAQLDLTSWTLVDPYNRWAKSHPTPTSCRMDETASSSVVGPGWIVSPFVLPATATFEITVQATGNGDDDFIGNPDLQPETAWGFDVGYERRLGGRGIVGLNFFYRSVTDLIEDVNTGLEGDGGPGTFIYSVANVGDGTVWGLEFDLSTPLTFIGLENTGVFLNYSWLDSEVTDFAGERRFNDQSNHVYNVGFIQDLPSWGAAFGVTYRKQGDAFGRVALEEIRTSYGADLEAFVEKRFGESFVVRLTGTNLLDSSKDEIFDKFGTLADQASRTYDEYELETEKAGPVVQLTARWAF